MRAEFESQKRIVEKSRYAFGVDSLLDSHEYFQSNPSPLYWRVSPYYLPQLTDSSCSLASATMIVNAALSHQAFGVNRHLASQKELLNQVNNNQWREAVKQFGDGVSLNQLKVYLESALIVYGVKNVTVTMKLMDHNKEENERIFSQALQESETTGKTFIIVNFNQKFVTNKESVGHFSPIGAYDIKNQRVLVMDPDRKYYEPYWVPLKLLLKSMSTPDQKGGYYRGYIVVNIK